MALTQTEAEVQEQLDGVYASIYISGGTTSQTVTSAGGFQLITLFNTADGVNGASNNATADKANSKITLTKNGIYKVELSISFEATTSSGGAGDIWSGAIYVGGIVERGLEFDRNIGNASAVGSLQCGGLVSVSTAPVDIELYMDQDDSSDRAVIIRECNLNAVRIGV